MQDELNLKDQKGAELQLLEVQQNIGFTLSEYPVEVLVSKMPSGPDDKESDFQIPEYQRNFSWDEPRQCKFIESVLMGLPIPFLFGYIDPELDDRTIIVDGVQRLNTLREFVENRLILSELLKLNKLNTYRFKDLSPLQQRRFLRRTLRMIILDETADPQTQFELFERINTGSKRPSPADIRRGAFPGPFRDLVVELAELPQFVELTPMGESKRKQREREELIVRLFCYTERYKDFSHDVSPFINQYMRDKNAECSEDPNKIELLRSDFHTFCEYSSALLPTANFGLGSRSTPRNQFEALAVPILVNVRKKTNLEDLGLNGLKEDNVFTELTKSGGSNSRVRLAQRIEYILDKIVDTDYGSD